MSETTPQPPRAPHPGGPAPYPGPPLLAAPAPEPAAPQLMGPGFPQPVAPPATPVQLPAPAPHPPAAEQAPAPQPQPPSPQPSSPRPAAEAPRTLQYRFDGPEDAPVLVIGPSLGTTWHMWDRQIPELAQHWRVFRYDLPGHGGAPAHAAPSVAELADRLIATLDGLGVQRFGYAGCSIGGAVGADLALRHPHRVASLALVASSPRFGTADEFRQRGVIVRANGLEPMARTAPERWFTPGFAAAQPAIVEWAVQMVRTTDPGCYIAACEALAAFDIRDHLGRIGVPTLVLVGAEDQVTGPAEARTLVAGIPDARLALVPGASHLAPVEQPAAVCDLLLTHFSTAWQDAPTAAPVPPLVPGPATPTTPFAPLAEIAPAPDAPEAVGPQRESRHERGTKVRREVLGDSHVDAVNASTDPFTEDFQELVTRYEWGEAWSRDGLDRRTRSCVTLTALVASGHLEGLAAHTRAALRNGLTPAEIKEVLLQTAVYCGIPAAGAAFTIAQSVIQEETTPPA
ncbi:alpha/beta fold hydrolase [Streptomyces sp. ISL-111]|uniref:bifunctional 3-oxoadipate enol-lactonase/4-carboxymuconolactone decarboxylase PcaDC n=1 Tax=unclassified Streptomyces TaxID=2593676 RepID=UPI001BECEED5|nr:MULTISPECIES: alpha/beta fold hydrolase [unclassified Streptomyces]MBT2381336.1 alpha/beta fold hydrolase [Streptomyces sp. ISL-111]MBT2425997.1 alpha/beta fold hydrolase [Streptomyces sp. ISL-112]MBT2465379.1 alpha/beta fold hydrolase [Streptomyces sp. ISL-63]